MERPWAVKNNQQVYKFEMINLLHSAYTVEYKMKGNVGSRNSY